MINNQDYFDFIKERRRVRLCKILLFIWFVVMLFAFSESEAAGMKYVIEIRKHHYPTEKEPKKITFERGAELFNTRGECTKEYLSPEFQLGLKAYYHGKGINFIKSRCIEVLPGEVGA